MFSKIKFALNGKFFTLFIVMQLILVWGGWCYVTYLGDILNGQSLLSTSIICVNPIIEFIFIVFIQYISVSSKNNIVKIFSGIICSCYFIVITIQYYFVFYSGEFIQILALENLNQLYLLLTIKKVIAVVAFLICIIIFNILLFSINIQCNFCKCRKKIYTSFIILFICYIVQNYALFREYNSFSPLLDLVSKLSKSSFIDETNNSSYTITKVNFDSSIYKRDLPFKKLYSEKFPNIILIFMEGTSSRLLENYNPKTSYTPNILDFANNSLTVDNYFNHTAATFRGIHGQLASCYPSMGGYDIGMWSSNASSLKLRKYQTLPKILSKSGYKTIFISPHSESDPLADMIDMLGFKVTYNLEDIVKSNIGAIVKSGAVRDVDIYNFLNLKLEENKELSSPFFLSLYTFGTHANLDVTSDEDIYGDGKNSVLNTLSFTDKSFGEFWKYFKKSKYYENTIVILTADHCHYYERPYLNLVKNDKDYKKFFIDKIPLIIYDPYIKFEMNRFDANGQTSLNLTPTILHLLGIKKVKNSFMGTSIFDDYSSNSINVAAIGFHFYYIYKNRVEKYSKKGNLPSKLKLECTNKVNRIINFYQMEKENLVFQE